MPPKKILLKNLDEKKKKRKLTAEQKKNLALGREIRRRQLQMKKDRKHD